MTLGHEKLDVYRLSIGYAARVYEKAEGLTGVHGPARDQSTCSVDLDPDSDFDPEERASRQADPLDALTSRQLSLTLAKSCS